MRPLFTIPNPLYEGCRLYLAGALRRRRPPAFEYHNALESEVNVTAFCASCLA